MKNLIKGSFILLFLFLLISGCAANLKAVQKQTNPEEDLQKNQAINELTKRVEALTDFLQNFNIIDQNFFDKNYDLDKLLEGACRGAVKAIDKYGNCLNKKDYLTKFEEDFVGEFGGIGIAIQKNKKDLVEVTEVFEGAPAYQVLESGDIILEVNGESLENKDLADIVRLIRGPEGTEVTLKIYRPKTDKELVVKIVRKKIELPNVIFQSLNEDINYIRIFSFNQKTSDLVYEALSKSKNAKIIVDLRNNPGGLVSSIKQVASLFLENGGVIYIFRDRDGNEEKIFSENENFFKNKIVVLINRYSASGSEMFAAAIKDNKRGLLVGEKTFGKGSAQSLFETLFGNPSVLKRVIILTTRRFLSPNGGAIEGEGIKPDIEIKEPENFKLGDLTTDTQLQKAVEILQNQ